MQEKEKIDLEEGREIAHKIIRKEKIKVLIYPVSIFAFIYGAWLTIHPQILETYKVYEIISNILTSAQVGGAFMVVSATLITAFRLGHRRATLFLSMILLCMWSVFTFSFIVTVPPNTVWILALTWTYFSFELVRRI